MFYLKMLGRKTVPVLLLKVRKKGIVIGGRNIKIHQPIFPIGKDIRPILVKINIGAELP